MGRKGSSETSLENNSLTLQTFFMFKQQHYTLKKVEKVKN